MPLLRFKVPWDQVEATPDQWTWAQFDRRYAAIRAAGLEPVLLAIGAPCWTRPGRPCAPGPPDPPFDSQWGEFVRLLVERYPDVAGVEVWNEPNIVPMWPPRPDPTRFASLLDAAHDAVESTDPDLPVISGGLFASDRSGGYGLADTTFLQAVLAAGAGDSIDAIGVHPYPRLGGVAGLPPRYDLRGMQQTIERMRIVRDAAGLSELPFWITEMGASTASAEGFPPGAAEDDQSVLLLAALREAEKADDVDVALIHRLVDLPSASAAGPLAEIESGFGVFGSDGKPKPSACALSDEYGGSLSC